MATVTDLGTEWAAALAARDADAVRALLHPEIDFKAVTPGRAWEANDVDGVLAILFDHWIEESDRVEAVERVETDAFLDRRRVGYRFRVACADGPHVFEQQAYYAVRDGRIAWMRAACSGYRPA
jgi:hypothetical protein